MQDMVSGEPATYIYDSLNRLLQASATGDPTGTCDVLSLISTT